jgi:hypothetical protein
MRDANSHETREQIPETFSWRDGGVGMTHLMPTELKTYSRRLVFLTVAVIVALSVGCKKSEQAAAGPKTFASQEDASKAVYDAAKAGDNNTLLTIFGPDSKDLLFSGDAVQDQAALRKFTTSYDQMHRWERLRDGGLALDVGAENYPFPFPLLKNSSGQWYFDGNSAKEEILARRIGGNELAAIDVLYAMADAQAEYYSQTHDGHIQQYAQKFISDEGKQNGLYWKAAENQPESPLGPLAAYASAEGYTGKPQASKPFHGYFYRIITKQGDQVPGGAQDYIVDGNMTARFAILAYPAEYRNSGVMSFLINQDGAVVQKDLGEKTVDVAKKITEFNPGDSWKPVE